LSKLAQKSLKALSRTLTKEIENERIAEHLVIVNECEKIPPKAIRAKTPLDVRNIPSSFELQVNIIEPVEPRRIEYRIALKGWLPAEGDKPLLQVMKRTGRDLVKWENSVIRNGLLSAAGKSIVTREIAAALNELPGFITGNGYKPSKLLIHPSDAVRLVEAGMITRQQFHPDFSRSKGSSFIGMINDLDVHCMQAMRKGIAIIYDHLEVELFRITPKMTFDDLISPKSLIIPAQCAVLPTAAAVATVDFRHSS
jgi:hypothetical protein